VTTRALIRSIVLVCAPVFLSGCASVRVEQSENKVDIHRAGELVLSYQAKPVGLPRPGIDSAFLRGGYIHPVMTPNGIRVTDDYPDNHLHHHGIWFSWTNTRFENRKPDFWNMGLKKGTVEFVSVLDTWKGAENVGLRSEHRYVDLLAPQPKVALNEQWEVIVRDSDAKAESRDNLFDIVVRQRCASDQPLVLPKYHYGGIGFRGHEQWNGATALRVLTSEGETDRVKANETRGRWCRISGEVDGKTAGIAILGHPKNFRAPQPMRVHPTEPFFCYAPSQLGEWSIKPGETYVSHYRFVVFDGELSAKEIDRLWAEFARN
jgi:hypothetical protein